MPEKTIAVRLITNPTVKILFPEFKIKGKCIWAGCPGGALPFFLQIILANAWKSLRLKITLLFLAALLHFFVQIENVVNLRADYICK